MKSIGIEVVLDQKPVEHNFSVVVWFLLFYPFLKKIIPKNAEDFIKSRTSLVEPFA